MGGEVVSVGVAREEEGFGCLCAEESFFFIEAAGAKSLPSQPWSLVAAREGDPPPDTTRRNSVFLETRGVGTQACARPARARARERERGRERARDDAPPPPSALPPNAPRAPKHTRNTPPV